MTHIAILALVAFFSPPVLESSAAGISNTSNTSSHRAVGWAVDSGVQEPVCWRTGSLSSGHAKVLPQAAAIVLSTSEGYATCVDSTNRMYGYDFVNSGGVKYPVSYRWMINTSNAVTAKTWTPTSEVYPPGTTGYRTGEIFGCQDGTGAYDGDPRGIGDSNVYSDSTITNHDETAEFKVASGGVATIELETLADAFSETGFSDCVDMGLDINNLGEAVGEAHPMGFSPGQHHAYYAEPSTTGGLDTPTYVGITTGGTKYDVYTANALNDGGYVTGHVPDCYNSSSVKVVTSAAYLAYHDGVTLTANPTGYGASEGLAINGNNVVVGVCYDPAAPGDPVGFVWDTVASSIYVPTFTWDGLPGPILSQKVFRVTGIADDGYVCGEATVVADLNGNHIQDPSDYVYSGAFCAKL